MGKEIVENLKKAILNERTSIYGRERTNEEKFLFKQNILKLYTNGKGI